MSKRQLIDAIRELNQSAALQFLAQFSEDELRQYLDRLAAVRDRAMYIYTEGGSVGEELRRVS